MNPLEWQSILSTVATLIGLVAVGWAVLRFLFREKWRSWLAARGEDFRAPISAALETFQTANRQEHEAAETSRTVLVERVEEIASTVALYHVQNQRGHRVMLRRLLDRPADEAEDLLEELEDEATGSSRVG